MHIEQAVHQSDRLIIYFVNNFKISLLLKLGIEAFKNVKENIFFQFSPYKIPKNVKLDLICYININVTYKKSCIQPQIYNSHPCNFIITCRKVVQHICYTLLCDYVFVCVIRCVWNDIINTNCSLILYLRNCKYITKAIPYIETYQILRIRVST